MADDWRKEFPPKCSGMPEHKHRDKMMDLLDEELQSSGAITLIWRCSKCEHQWRERQ